MGTLCCMYEQYKAAGRSRKGAAVGWPCTWGKNGANHTPANAIPCQFMHVCTYAKRRRSLYVTRLWRLFLLILQHNWGVFCSLFLGRACAGTGPKMGTAEGSPRGKGCRSVSRSSRLDWYRTSRLGSSDLGCHLATTKV